VDCKRPWFGAPRSFDFADVAALETKMQSLDDSNDLMIRIKLRDGERIILGRANEGQHEQIHAYIEEIQGATGIAARHVVRW
jgi:hypothetical protein